MEVGSYMLEVVGWLCVADTSTSLSVTGVEVLEGILNEKIKNLKWIEI